ncbi:glutamine synthetase family protein [Novosphingobium sp. SG707]|uniref:glutamine synthetase family protein n=1 Tax=Novosphingobium sp. SG707 TaxID=2586996 RepID=UPI00144516F8|nr:glutamine synthetase family protein [Novosphingobium sp. SG707]NKI98044.1 glutamine synthetase [Novosphingobium sp. SG707]
MTVASGDRFVTVAVVDTNGLLRGQKLAADDLPGILENGVGMSPAQLALDPTDVFLDMPGVTDDSADFHDSQLAVDRASRVTMPFEQSCDSGLYFAQFTGDAARFCPRSLLAKVLARGAQMGMQPRIGFELEFTLFDETPASLAEKGFEDLTTATAHASHDLLIYQAFQSEFYCQVADMAQTLGIRLGKMHEEIGGGFMEACVGPGRADATADQAVLLKNFLKILAMRRGQTACFMPRWSLDADSQSSHLHLSLLDGEGAPLFWDAARPDRMSDTFRHFIGGLQRFLPEVMLLFAPTVNSWRRFAPGTFAPPAFTWGIENRTTCLRVVGHGPGSIRVENRLPCADANPQLVAAASIAAGLAGIAGRIEPGEQTIGNGYAAPPADAVPLPDGMEAAIAALEGSSFAREWLSERFVETYCATRRAQLAQFAGKTLIDERRRFFELG